MTKIEEDLACRRLRYSTTETILRKTQKLPKTRRFRRLSTVSGISSFCIVLTQSGKANDASFELASGISLQRILEESLSFRTLQ